MLNLLGTNSCQSTDYHGEGGGTYADMLDAHPPFQIDENFGSTSGIEEMLLQSSERYTDPDTPNEDRYVIDLLAALPSAWSNGSMHGRRARGGFQVDLVEGRRPQVGGIRSVGVTTAKMRYGSNTKAIHLRPGQQVQVRIVSGEIRVTPSCNLKASSWESVPRIRT